MIEIKNISTSKKAQTISFLATNEVLGDLNNSKTERLRYILQYMQTFRKCYCRLIVLKFSKISLANKQYFTYAKRIKFIYNKINSLLN